MQFLTKCAFEGRESLSLHASIQVISFQNQFICNRPKLIGNIWRTVGNPPQLDCGHAQERTRHSLRSRESSYLLVQISLTHPVR
jgi:hypothetical protein